MSDLIARLRIVHLELGELIRVIEEKSAAKDNARTATSAKAPANESVAASHGADEPSCPKCGGRMWDNRVSKRNPKAPDYKCRDRPCDGVIWPPKKFGDDED